jgi:hypothetical protein
LALLSPPSHTHTPLVQPLNDMIIVMRCRVVLLLWIVLNKCQVPPHAQFISDCDSLLICNEHNVMGASLRATKGETSGISRAVILWQQFVHSTSLKSQNSNLLRTNFLYMINALTFFYGRVFSHVPPSDCFILRLVCRQFILAPAMGSFQAPLAN